jgi:hypothetical protein
MAAFSTFMTQGQTSRMSQSRDMNSEVARAMSSRRHSRNFRLIASVATGSMAMSVVVLTSLVVADVGSLAGPLMSASTLSIDNTPWD